MEYHHLRWAFFMKKYKMIQLYLFINSLSLQFPPSILSVRLVLYCNIRDLFYSSLYVCFFQQLVSSLRAVAVLAICGAGYLVQQLNRSTCSRNSSWTEFNLSNYSFFIPQRIFHFFFCTKETRQEIPNADTSLEIEILKQKYRYVFFFISAFERLKTFK